jgi:hypothetical protein
MKTFWKRIKHAFSFKRLEGVVVPQADIDRIEQARLDLWKLLDHEPVEKQAWFTSVSGAMWLLSHRKYPPAI